MNEANKIKIYSTPFCPYCVSLKLFLEERGIKFEEIDIAKDEKAAQEIMTKTNQIGVPVLEVGDQIIIGFDKEKICKLLKIK